MTIAYSPNNDFSDRVETPHSDLYSQLSHRLSLTRGGGPSIERTVRNTRR